MTSIQTTGDITELRAKLAAIGLSDEGILSSTGIARHLERVRRGTITPAILGDYASELRALMDATAAGGAPIPVDFWDVRTPAMVAAKLDEYQMVSTLTRPEYGAYLSILGRCFERLVRFKTEQSATAVETALELLRASAEYVRGSPCLDMTMNCSREAPEPRAIFLWQQLVTGTNREIPYLHRDAFTHGHWERFNVVEMWRYRDGAARSVDEVWGLSGFAKRYIGDATNTNQIEHMSISALAQMVLGIPLFALNLLEDAEWMLRRSTYAASQADKRVNRAVAREFCRGFRLEDPRPACDALARALGEAAENS